MPPTELTLLAGAYSRSMAQLEQGFHLLDIGWNNVAEEVPWQIKSLADGIRFVFFPFELWDLH